MLPTTLAVPEAGMCAPGKSWNVRVFNSSSVCMQLYKHTFVEHESSFPCVAAVFATHLPLEALS
jgi:hypothetical protein